MSFRRQSELMQLLRQRFAQLKQQVQDYDRQLNQSTEKALNHSHRFHQGLFEQTGASLSQCIAQMDKDMTALERLSHHPGSEATFEYLCQQFSDRYQAVTQAMAATGVQVAGTKLKSRRQWQQRPHNQYQWIAQSVMSNSNGAYAELRKHQNWASRLEQKIRELEQKLDLHQGQEKIKLQNDILATHKRLGQCRQAMTYIEERIAQLEKRGHR
ncbi:MULTISPECIES: primosomal replication protein [Ferrimonas]|uniref:primosomal replication protein n=1 Tax=Ferrimonas TaxID=44011 RepID=UPI0004081216|nr:MULTISPECIES: primosomal replication protein [Ferrimonas]USD36438.1 primosomal replication protein [Ferrimonas sp. SCSIO 43195]